MPIYSYACDCGKTTEAFRRIEDRHDGPECHGPMHKILTPTAVFADLPAYQSPVTGKEVRGRKARHEDLKRNRCRPWEGREVEQAEARKAQEASEAKLDKSLEAGIHHVLSHIDSDKRAALTQ